MLSDKNKKIIHDFLNTSKENIIKDHLSLNQKASGKFIAGLAVVDNENGGQLIDGAGYSYFLEYGRKPTGSGGGGGGMSLLDSIKIWFAAKGLTITKGFNPYSVTKSIHAKGTVQHRKGGNSGVITNTVNDSVLNKFFEKFATEYHTEAYSEVSKTLTI